MSSSDGSASARPVLRPSRRTLLASTALVAPLGLAGCSDLDLPWSPRPRTQATLEPLTTAADPTAEHPVRFGRRAVSPRDGHPLAMIVVRQEKQELTAHIATGQDASFGTVPIDPATSGISVDDRTELLRFLTLRVVDGRYTTSMHTTPDLVDWTETDLTGVVLENVLACGAGTTVSEIRTVGETIVVVGRVTSPADGEAGWAQERPIAWESTDGLTASAVEIPLPSFGPEGWSWEDGTWTGSDVAGYAPTGIGGCVWASLDGGETWDRTMIPGQEGSFPEVIVQRDGDDALVLVDGAAAPYAYRITGVAADILEDA